MGEEVLLTEDQSRRLRRAIADCEPDWLRAYELRQDGVAGPDLARAFGLKSPNRPRTWAKAVALLLGELEVGEFRRTDRVAGILVNRLIALGGIDGDLRDHIIQLGARATDAFATVTYDNPQARAWETIRARQADDAEAEADLDEEVTDERRDDASVPGVRVDLLRNPGRRRSDRREGRVRGHGANLRRVASRRRRRRGARGAGQ